MACKNKGVSLKKIREDGGVREIEGIRFYLKSHSDNVLEMDKTGPVLSS